VPTITKNLGDAMLPTARLMNAQFCSKSDVEHLVKALAAALREERSRVDGVA
jgi:hypothetical protein